MAKHRIPLILFLIVILPMIFYSTYEITSLNDNEKLIEEVYVQQMNLILYGVNKHAWDVSRDWADRIELILEQPQKKLNSLFEEFLIRNSAIETVFIADTALQRSATFKYSNQIQIPELEMERVLTQLENFQPQIRRLIHRKSVGYTQIESFSIPANSPDSLLSLLFVTQPEARENKIVALVLDTDKFIRQILQPNLLEAARDEFILGIFKESAEKPLFSNAAISSDQVKLQRKIWIFPAHYLGIRLKNNLIANLARSRFQRSLILIFILGVTLIVSAVILYRNIQHEMELARMKSDFVSNVSHELRTPLALIRMYAEMMNLGMVTSDTEKKEYYQIIEQESERLTLIINNILDFSKMEAGQKQFNLEKIELNQLIRQVVNTYEFHLKNKGFTLEFMLENTQLEINADKNAVTECLVNLLDNAIKYSNETKAIKISTGIQQNFVFFEVKDSGVGIPPTDQKRIFDKFYRTSDNFTQTRKGSGLGLSLVKYIVDAHAGKIELQSTLGKGSRFRLLFPRNLENIKL